MCTCAIATVLLCTARACPNANDEGGRGPNVNFLVQSSVFTTQVRRIKRAQSAREDSSVHLYMCQGSRVGRPPAPPPRRYGCPGFPIPPTLWVSRVFNGMQGCQVVIVRFSEPDFVIVTGPCSCARRRTGASYISMHAILVRAHARNATPSFDLLSKHCI